MPYRSLPSGDREVAIAFRPSYWVRLIATLRARWVILAAYSVGALLIALVVSWMVGTLRYAEAEAASAWDAALAALPVVLPVTLGVVVGPLVLAIAVRCALPSPHEKHLPVLVVFREASIDVSSRKGETRTERWSYIVEAKESNGALELVIGREPRLSLFVAKSRISRRQLELLRGWIGANGVRMG